MQNELRYLCNLALNKPTCEYFCLGTVVSKQTVQCRNWHETFSLNLAKEHQGNLDKHFNTLLKQNQNRLFLLPH